MIRCLDCFYGINVSPLQVNPGKATPVVRVISPGGFELLHPGDENVVSDLRSLPLEVTIVKGSLKVLAVFFEGFFEIVCGFLLFPQLPGRRLPDC